MKALVVLSLLLALARVALAEPDDDALPAPHEPVKMRIGIAVTGLDKLDLAVGTFNAEFVVTVKCDREPCKPDLDVINGKLSGKPEKVRDDKLLKKLKMKAELSAAIDLTEYPFDSHQLPIILFDKGDPDQVTLEIEDDPAHTRIEEGPSHIKLPGWEATKWEANVETENDGENDKVSLVYFNVDIQRPLVASFTKGLVPVLLLLVVAAFQLMLKPKGAAGRLAASTATLTAAVTFHVGQLVSLPSNGYLTRLDKFMVAAYVVILVHIAFNVLMVRAEEAKDEKRSALLYAIAKGLVPGLALVLWTAVVMRIV